MDTNKKEQEMAEEQKRSVTERHIQTAAVAVIIGLILWVGTTVTGNSKTGVELKVKVDQLVKNFDKMDRKLEAGVEDRYKRSDAVRDHSLINTRVDALNIRVRKLENGNHK